MRPVRSRISGFVAYLPCSKRYFGGEPGATDAPGQSRIPDLCAYLTLLENSAGEEPALSKPRFVSTVWALPFAMPLFKRGH